MRSGDDAKTAQLMWRLWHNFAEFGTPEGNQVWHKFDPQRGNYVQIAQGSLQGPFQGLSYSHEELLEGMVRFWSTPVVKVWNNQRSNL